MFLILILVQASGEYIVPGIEAMQKISFKLLARLIIDLLTVVLLIKAVYYPLYKKRELNFTFFVFNLVIFLICFLLNKVDLSMGAAFGLFAVFSMLRYRTEEISIKDMTYLFLVIAIGLISAVTKIKDASDVYEYIFISCVNGTVVLLAFFLESSFFSKKEASRTVNYDNIKLVHEGSEAALREDLKSRTGLNIHRVTIVKIDFVNDTAQIKIYFYEV